MSIENDIGKWSYDKLVQWSVDSMDRYEMIGMDEQDAMRHVVVNLMAMTARILSYTDATSNEAGQRLRDAIEFLREGRRAKHAERAKGE